MKKERQSSTKSGALFLIACTLALLSFPFPSSVLAADCCSMPLKVALDESGGIKVLRSSVLRIDDGNPVPYISDLCLGYMNQTYFTSSGLRDYCLSKRPSGVSQWDCHVALRVDGVPVEGCVVQGSDESSERSDGANVSGVDRLN